MLKEFLVMALAAFCLSEAYTPSPLRTADMDYLQKQTKIYDLFRYINQEMPKDQDGYELGSTYEFSSYYDYYTNKAAIDYYLQKYKYNRLNQDAIFSIFYPEHRDEVKALFKVFYYAKDFQTFYKTACWARMNTNSGVFLYAFSAAVSYRPDTKYIRLPTPYEVFPSYFFEAPVIQQAQYIKMARGYSKASTGVDNYVIYANYTDNYQRQQYENEYQLDYFIEDIGLNAYYYYCRTLLPYWLTSKDYGIPKDIRGDLYYYIHKQLLSRYYLERLSNDLGEIEDFDWNKPFIPGFYSNLQYPNGVFFPQREVYSQVPEYKYKYLKYIQAYESRILAAVDSGYAIDKEGRQYNIYSSEGINILGNMIEGNYDSYNYYYYGSVDYYSRQILGFNWECYNPDKCTPSALQQYSTSMRDPAFYKLYKRIMYLFFRYKERLPSYTYDELVYPELKIESVTVDKLTTYFDYYDAWINNAVGVENMKDGQSFNIKARQYRLNYKPYTYQIQVNSQKSTKAVIRIFLGPYYDYIQDDAYYFQKYYMNFYELDQFVVNLSPGANNILRRSTESVFTIPEDSTEDSFYRKMKKATEGSEPFTYSEKLYGFPQRLLLPKGKRAGMYYKLFFYVSPLDDYKSYNYDFPLYGKINYDSKPLGYPLDRPMYTYNYTMPNAYFKDVQIYHNYEGEYSS
ncbi:arylphorin subunit alpha [Orussus abietinus]|uniref:arylphorin subunit alpha n=1 Tax=Orussus abietinus TaxID=222816 RepID=UPI000625F803|nr:arylphorin subunit alpha [Orussus abietinus]